MVLLCLAQTAVPPAPAPPVPTVAPGGPPQMSARDKQRESVRRQVRALGLDQSAGTPTPGVAMDDFFTTSWPRPAGFGDGKTLPASNEAMPAVPKVTPSSYREAARCLPVPSAELDGLIGEAARREGLSSDLVRAVIQKESAGLPCAVSPVGAMGLMQLMPGTAKQLGVRDPYNARQSVDAGSRYLRELLDRYDGDLTRALGAYNAGPGQVDSYGGVPPFAETRGYVGKILKMLGQ